MNSTRTRIQRKRYIATAPITFIDACKDAKLFLPWFKNPATWKAWFAFINALFGTPMTRKEREIFKQYTGRDRAPRQRVSEAYLIMGRRGGKALALDTPILTVDGWKEMRDIHPGDYVYGADGEPTAVIAETETMEERDCYRVVFDNGDSIVADGQHEWVTSAFDERAKNRTKRFFRIVDPSDYENVPAVTSDSHRFKDLTGKQINNLSVKKCVGKHNGDYAWLCQCVCGTHVVTSTIDLHEDVLYSCGCDRFPVRETVRTTEELYQTQKASNGCSNHSIRVCSIEGHETELPIDPYVLGVWLGDGHASDAYITTVDAEIVEEIEARGYGMRRLQNPLVFTMGGEVKKTLRDMGVLYNKHIPPEYLTASREDRLALLRGLMDSDGTADKDGGTEFYNTNEKLVDGFVTLAASLGIKPFKRQYSAVIDGKDCGLAWKVYFSTSIEVFLLSRKLQRQNSVTDRPREHSYYVRRVEKVESVPVKCIQVAAPDGLYLAGRSLVLTHNSFILAMIAVYLACFIDWRDYLSPGERGTVFIMASDRKQARVIFRYIHAFLHNIPMLKKRIERETNEVFDLRGQVSIEIQTASFRGIRGYALCVETPIATPEGFKRLGDIEVGDFVFDERGQPTQVTAVFDREPEEAFRLTFSDGSTIDADAEHQWVTWDERSRSLYHRRGLKEEFGAIPDNWPVWDSSQLTYKGIGRPTTDFGFKIRDTKEIANSLCYGAEGNRISYNHQIPNTKPLCLPQRKGLLLDPYLLGLWLGDGTTTSNIISTDFSNGDSDWVCQSFERAGFGPIVRIDQYAYRVNGLLAVLRGLGVLGNKDIPQHYLWSSEEQRLALLQGLMDSDGHLEIAGSGPSGSRKVSFTSIREDHAEAVTWLARSLGQKPVMKKHKKTEGYAGKPFYYTVSWCSTVNPFRLPRKAEAWEQSSISKELTVRARAITGCAPIATKPMRCLTVDSPNSMYLCGEALIPTHNTVVAALLDEIAFWRSDESANPDYEILTALKPATATVPGAMILCASSPYARRGVLYNAYERYYGEDSDSVLVWKAPTWVMNPAVPQEFIDEEYEKDPASAAAEFGAEFRKDVQAFIPQEVIDACRQFEVFEIPPHSNIQYAAFVDPSGGSQDSMTLAIAHFDEKEDKHVLDYIGEWKPPFSPDGVAKEMSEVLARYKLSAVTGDRYGGEWPRERFKEHGIDYEICEKPKNVLYRELLPMLMSKRALLLDSKILRNQLIGLERRVGRSGQDIIDHAPGMHDDVANAVAGALVYAQPPVPFDFW